MKRGIDDIGPALQGKSLGRRNLRHLRIVSPSNQSLKNDHEKKDTIWEREIEEVLMGRFFQRTRSSIFFNFSLKVRLIKFK
jgi:hypothetical protein